MKYLKNILANLIRPKFRFIYTKKNGEQGIYIVTNPTALKGSMKTTFSNPMSRARGDHNIGFRAVCLNRPMGKGKFGIRSFYYKKIQDLHRVGLLEEVA
jgi:hypothetical protein